MSIEGRIAEAIDRGISIMARYHDAPAGSSEVRQMRSEVDDLAAWTADGPGPPPGGFEAIIGPVRTKLRSRYGAGIGLGLAVEFAASFLLAAGRFEPREPPAGPGRMPRWMGISIGPAPRFDTAQDAPMDPNTARPGHPSIKVAVGSRLRSARLELLGVAGVAKLAEDLGVPARTWANDEAGVTIPGEVLLRFIEITGVSPSWLLRGVGRRYSSPLL